MERLSSSDGYMSKIERYRFNVPISGDMDPALVLCYALASSDKLILKQTDLYGKDGADSRPVWHRKYDEYLLIGTFSTLKSFLSIYSNGDFGHFTLCMSYNNMDMVLNGDTGSTEVNVSYPKNGTPNLIPIFRAVEEGLAGLVYNVKNMTISQLEEIMKEHGLAIRAIPYKSRTVYELSQKDKHPDAKVQYIPEYGRNMLVEEIVIKDAGKFMVESVRNDQSIAYFSHRYFDSIESSVTAIISGKAKSPENILTKRLTGRGCIYHDCYAKTLQGYEDDEEDGRILHLPCKPGDTVYIVEKPAPEMPWQFRPEKMLTFAVIVADMEQHRFGNDIFVDMVEAERKAAELNEKE